MGSTALTAQTDPEVVRSQMARSFKRITDIAEACGGTAEKFAEHDLYLWDPQIAQVWDVIAAATRS